MKPATDKEIREMQEMLAKTPNDPNMVIVESHTVPWDVLARYAPEVFATYAPPEVFATYAPAQQRPPIRNHNHIGFKPKPVTPSHVPGGYVSPYTITGTTSSSITFTISHLSAVDIGPPKFKSFEGTVNGIIEIQE